MKNDPSLMPVPQTPSMADLGLGEPDLTSEQVSPLQRLHALLRGRYHWAALLGLVLGVGGAVGGWFLKAPIYEALGMIQVKANLDPKLYIGVTGMGQIPQLDRFIDTQKRRLASDRVIAAALQKPSMQPFSLGSAPAMVTAMAKRIEADSPGGSETILVSFRDVDPLFAQAMVKSVVESFMDIHGRSEEEDFAEKMRELEDYRLTKTNDLRSLDEEYNAILQENGHALYKMADRQIEEFQQIDALLKAIETELNTRGVAGGVAQAQVDPRSLSADALAEHTGSQVLRDLVAQKRAVEGQMDILRVQGMGPRHREMQKYQIVLDQLNQRVAEFRTRLLETNNDTLNSSPLMGLTPETVALLNTDQLLRRKQELVATRAEANAKMEKLSRARLELDKVTERMNNTKDELRTVESQIAKLRFEMMSREGLRTRLEVLEYGKLPDEPANAGSRKQLAVMGGIAGLGLGFAVMLFIGFLDQRLRTIEDATTNLSRTRMLGILPALPEDLADPAQASIAAHCVHHIRTMLQIGENPDHRRVFTVTSPGPGAGKTSLTLALGLSFSASGSRTLLIDCDLVGGGLTRRVAAVVRRRIGHMLQKQGLVTAQQVEEALRVAQNAQKRLGEVLIELGYVSADDLASVLSLQEETSVGVMDACNGEPFENCIADTGVRNLFVLPTGTAVARHVGSLSPGAIRRLLQAARERFDTILVDSGPILGSIEASAVAGEVDGVVMIVSRGDQRATADQAAEYLQSINANLLGIVFNRADAADFERSRYGSIASLSSRAPGDQRPMPEAEVMDADASARLGPVGSAVATNTRMTRNGKGKARPARSTPREEETAGRA
jgi:Mrp family chromosome partitioning ATPase